MMLFGLCLTLFAQPPKLIFTEFAMPANEAAHYYELTNMETSTTLDLRDFCIKHYGWWMPYPTGGWPSPNTLLKFKDVLDDSNAFLAPGESFVITMTMEGVDDDGYPLHRQALNDVSDLLIYADESGDPTLEHDSISTSIWWVRNPDGEEGKVLWYLSSPTDSVAIDAINNWVNPETNSAYRAQPSPVAGVEEANRTHTFIRKANITQGNLDWNNARGNDLSDSEWLPVLYDPTNVWNPVVFSTVGNHGVFSIEISSEKVIINETAGTITVPWGIRKGTWDVTNSRSQGIFDAITFGDGLAWNYEEHGDTATTACQTGDILNVFAVGNTLINKAYNIISEAPAANNALALPMRVYNSFYQSWLHGTVSGGIAQPTDPEDRRLLQQFYITENMPGMDTIGYLPYAVRIDTLLANIEIAPNASIEIIFVDGKERVDLKEGDILRITAEDGSTTKDYYLDLEHITKSTNALLSAITWPDMPFEMNGWKGDTIPGFSPSIFSYTITVPFGISNVPALVPFKQDLNSTVKIERAVTLNGTREDMTTIITVSSQDTSKAEQKVNVYKITFEMEKLEEHLQPYKATPFISEIVWRICEGEATFIEIANVGNQPLNLENYMFMLAVGGGTPADIIPWFTFPDSSEWVSRYTHYIPGFKHGTFEEWKINPAVMKPDPSVDPIVEPGGTFVIGRFHQDQFNPANTSVHMNKWEEVDIHWSQFLENEHGEMGFNYNQTIPFLWKTLSIMVFEIINPAVLEGNKPVNDPADFVLVDLWGNFVQGSDWVVAGVTADNGIKFGKKPSAWRPNIDQNGGWGTNAEDSDWSVVWQRDVNNSNDIMSEDIGNYSHDPITIFMSTVSSTAYIVDPGYEGELQISGVSIGSTVEDCLGNIIKADEGQNLSVISKSTGLVLEPEATVTNGDILKVVSADMVNTTNYSLKVAAGGLDSNAELTAAGGSGLTITTTGETGTIEGIVMGSTIAEVLDLVIKPELAVLNVVDKNNNLVPLKVLNPDQILISTKVMGDLYFEVVAQNQTTIITYKLVLDISASDAWVTSNLYDVSQDNHVISLVPEGVSVNTMLENLVPSGKSSMVLLDKTELKRDSGYVVEDDILRVTSEDQSMSVDYSIRFLGAPLRTMAYVTSDVYDVDEILLVIGNIPSQTAVANFLINLNPAPGAIVTLLDGSDNVKETGMVTSNDKIRVVAEDGVTETFYTLDVLVSNLDLNKDEISIYPNPVSDVLYISGLTKGSTIHLSSITGQKVKVMEAVTDPAKVSVDGLTKGYYIIKVIDPDQKSILFRFVKN